MFIANFFFKYLLKHSISIRSVLHRFCVWPPERATLSPQSSSVGRSLSPARAPREAAASHSGEVRLARSLPPSTRARVGVTALPGSLLSSVPAGAHSLRMQRFLTDDTSGRTGYKRGKCLPTPLPPPFCPAGTHWMNV